MNPTIPFPCFLVDKADDGSVTTAVSTTTLDDLPLGDVVIEVAWSSLNYKDALACQGHPGVVRTFPLVPGIDCAGRVARSDSPSFKEGDEVLLTGYGLGVERWGGFAAFVRAPAEWIVPLPEPLTVRECMIYGTAGFTAAQAVTAIRDRGIEPASGPVVVTGATGGVGSIAVAILAKLGYEVTAVTGKIDQHDLLRQLGARVIVNRDEVVDTSSRPLLKARWSAAIDTVGGVPLATILRGTQHRGCVAACGLVAGHELPLTVHPFILRGITLAGIDSAACPRPQRLEMWRRLASEWRVDSLEWLASEITLAELPARVDAILSGQVVGRTLVNPGATAV